MDFFFFSYSTFSFCAIISSLLEPKALRQQSEASGLSLVQLTLLDTSSLWKKKQPNKKQQQKNHKIKYNKIFYTVVPPKWKYWTALCIFLHAPLHLMDSGLVLSYTKYKGFHWKKPPQKWLQRLSYFQQNKEEPLYHFNLDDSHLQYS